MPHVSTRPCSFPTCDRPLVARELCSTHYAQRGRGVPLTPIYSSQRPRGSSLVRDECGRKECCACREWWPEDHFGPYKKSVDGLRNECRACRIARYQENKTEIRERHRLRKFGITTKQFAEMLQAQGGGCATCAVQVPTGIGWVIDHDHACCPGGASCGACVRGILCSNCNNALGLVRDSPQTLMRMIAYLT